MGATSSMSQMSQSPTKGQESLKVKVPANPTAGSGLR